MIKCRICSHKVIPIITFGKMPIANGFVKKPSPKEFVFVLGIVFCPKCFMVQLEETVPPEKMFHDHYQFFSSTSKGMENHFRAQAKHIKKLIKKNKNPFVVEIGSNDGIMLKFSQIKNQTPGYRTLKKCSSGIKKIRRKCGVCIFQSKLCQKNF